MHSHGRGCHQLLPFWYAQNTGMNMLMSVTINKTGRMRRLHRAKALQGDDQRSQPPHLELRETPQLSPLIEEALDWEFADGKNFGFGRPMLPPTGPTFSLPYAPRSPARSVSLPVSSKPSLSPLLIPSSLRAPADSETPRPLLTDRPRPIPGRSAFFGSPEEILPLKCVPQPVK